MFNPTHINEETAIFWMHDRGKVSYLNNVRALEACIDETIAEAGRYGQYCEFTQARVKAIKEQIAEEKQAAYDRYQDWATD